MVEVSQAAIRNGRGIREELDNLLLIRKYLKKLNRSPGERLKSKREDGRGGRIDEAGSISDISKWINANGEVMARGKISGVLNSADNHK